MNDLEAYQADQRRRTAQQNKAMHKYFQMLADELNGAGLTIEKTMTQPIELPWSPDTIKELMWRKVQMALTEKESTTELERNEITEIYDVINKHLSQTFGVHVPFPTRELEQ